MFSRLLVLFSLLTLLSLIHAAPTPDSNSGPGDWPKSHYRRAALVVSKVKIHKPIASPRNVIEIYKDGATFCNQATVQIGAQLKQIKTKKGVSCNTKFDFRPVDSTFMGYSNQECFSSPSTGICYGHLRAHNSNLVLSVNFPGRAVTHVPSFDQEAYSDDSSQLLQFWSYDPTTSMLTFLGITRDGITDPLYEDYQGPYASEGYAESNGLAILANAEDAEGAFYFKKV